MNSNFLRRLNDALLMILAMLLLANGLLLAALALLASWRADWWTASIAFALSLFMIGWSRLVKWRTE